MGDVSSQPLQLVRANEEARPLDAPLETGGGALRRVSAPQTAPPIAVAEFARLVALVERLEQKVQALEAELVPPNRSCKCPCCHRLSLAVVATRPHPVFGNEGIEQHDVHCRTCGYKGSRLYDPSNFLR
jgi:hypothetical protein